MRHVGGQFTDGGQLGRLDQLLCLAELDFLHLLLKGLIEAGVFDRHTGLSGNDLKQFQIRREKTVTRSLVS